MTAISLRPAISDDRPFLFEMLFEAVNWPGLERLTRSQIRATPELMHYIDGWPAAGEFGFIASAHPGHPLGACWTRLFPATDPGYGYVADDVPELILAVAIPHRRQGIGGQLLAATIAEARTRGFSRLSLSVEDHNKSTRLYSRLGFTVARHLSGAATMVLDLAATNSSAAGLSANSGQAV